MQTETEVRRTDRYVTCWTCGGEPDSHPSGRACICGDGTHESEVTNLRREIARLEEALARIAAMNAPSLREALQRIANQIAPGWDPNNAVQIAREALRETP